jgi:hypothetical protein
VVVVDVVTNELTLNVLTVSALAARLVAERLFMASDEPAIVLAFTVLSVSTLVHDITLLTPDVST